MIINGIKVIPQVKVGSDFNYWKEVFPSAYMDRKIVEIKLGNLDSDKEYPYFVFDGDIKKIKVGDKDRICCSKCNGAEFKPVLFGSIDVGLEVIYKCKNCGSIHRVYTPENVINFLIDRKKYIVK